MRRDAAGVDDVRRDATADALGWTPVAKGRGTTELVAENAERGTSGSIILFHANAMRSVDAMSMVIDDYRNKGYGFVTLGQLFGLGGPVPYS